jgi:hypothetical protein
MDLTGEQFRTDKARLHGQFLLQFSPFGGREGVDYLMMLL